MEIVEESVLRFHLNEVTTDECVPAGKVYISISKTVKNDEEEVVKIFIKDEYADMDIIISEEDFRKFLDKIHEVF